ncbi:Uncharacterised protein [Dorea longicatena]|nr:Uncharacterised protein [Dorea longicatena]
MGIGILLFAITTLAKGGFKEAYNTVRQKAYLCASTTSMYTVFGSLCYDLINQTAARLHHPIRPPRTDASERRALH